MSACVRLLEEPKATVEQIAAKTFATQTALEVTSDAIQILGGNGITKEYFLEKLFRDARTTLICDGSNDTLSFVGGHKISNKYPRR